MDYSTYRISKAIGALPGHEAVTITRTSMYGNHTISNVSGLEAARHFMRWHLQKPTGCVYYIDVKIKECTSMDLECLKMLKYEEANNDKLIDVDIIDKTGSVFRHLNDIENEIENVKREAEKRNAANLWDEEVEWRYIQEVLPDHNLSHTSTKIFHPESVFDKRNLSKPCSPTPVCTGDDVSVFRFYNVPGRQTGDHQLTFAERLNSWLESSSSVSLCSSEFETGDRITQIDRQSTDSNDDIDNETEGNHDTNRGSESNISDNPRNRHLRTTSACEVDRDYRGYYPGDDFPNLESHDILNISHEKPYDYLCKECLDKFLEATLEYEKLEVFYKDLYLDAFLFIGTPPAREDQGTRGDDRDLPTWKITRFSSRSWSCMWLRLKGVIPVMVENECADDSDSEEESTYSFTDDEC